MLSRTDITVCPGQLCDRRRHTLVVRPPQHCPRGHAFTPGAVLVGHAPCGCGRRGGHMTWACECGAVVYAPPLSAACAVVYAPPLSAACAVLAGPAAVR